ncbi:MAG: hypothetical protein JKY93_01020 [Gammaproteobacteria bacterium]|nr:hypothetical protein [Gammaproteobacteria bacterium]
MMLEFCAQHNVDPAIFSQLFLNKATSLVNELEALETPTWAADAVLEEEICTRRVIDPNCGTGVLAEAARRKGYEVYANDIFNWGYEHQSYTYDFLSEQGAHHLGGLVSGSTVFLNPPFKLSCEFLLQCRLLGARKVILFQNITWMTSKTRREFWKNNPPTRTYIFAERATTWRFDVPEHKRIGTTSKTFAFFVWDGWDNPAAPTSHLLYKGGA